MAINIPSGFGTNYGAAAQRQTDFMQDAAKSAGSFIKTPKDKYDMALNEELNPFSETLMEAYGAQMVDPVTGGNGWESIDFTKLSNAGASYLDFKKDLSGRGLKYAKKNNLLNPIAYKKQFDERVNSLVPLLAQKIQGYALGNNASDSDMREFIKSNKGLKELLINAGYAGAESPIRNYLIDEKTLGQQWSDFGQNLGKFAQNRFAPTATGLPLTLAGGAAAAKWGPGLGSKAFNWAKGKMPSFGGQFPPQSKLLHGAGTGPKASKSMVQNFIKQFGGKNKLVTALASRLGKSVALRVVGGLAGKAAIPLALLGTIMMLVRNKDEYAEAQKQRALQTQSLAQPPTIAGAVPITGALPLK